jgi:hypothetical protein
MLPVALPKHNTFICVAVGVSGAAGWVIVAECVFVQPFKSVITTEYTPELKLEISCDTAPFDQAYVYPGVPPPLLKLIDPSLPPKHDTFTCV